jgi:hypothetical protein
MKEIFEVSAMPKQRRIYSARRQRIQLGVWSEVQPY